MIKSKQTLRWCFHVFFPILFYILFSQIMASIILAALLLVFSVFQGSGAVSPMDLADDFYMNHLLLVTAVMSVAVLPFFIWFYNRDEKLISGGKSYWRCGSQNAEPVFCQYKTVPAVRYGFNALLGIGMCLAVNNIFTLFRMEEYFDSYQPVAESLYQNNLLFELLSMGLLIPFTEELLFRGLCFKRIRERCTFLPAAVLSALIFGIYHGNMLQGIYAFLLGLAMAYVYEKYHSLAAPYVFHASANVLSVLLTETALSEWFYGRTALLISAAVGLVFCILGYYLIQKYIKPGMK